MTATVQLPYPPSANRLWRNVNGRTLKSLAYRQWLDLAVTMARLARLKPVRGPYKLSMVATRPDNRRRDLDNLIKPVSDALVAAGMVEGDHLAQSLEVSWSSREPVKGGDLVVWVEAA